MITRISYFQLFQSEQWLVSLVYACCSHLESRASVKRFDSLQFLNPFGRTPWMSVQPVGRPLRNTNTE
jgi:hypothetical protein